MSAPVADDDIVIATFNPEQNGMGDAERRRAAYTLIAQNGARLLPQQELPCADQARHVVMHEVDVEVFDAEGISDRNTVLARASRRQLPAPVASTA